ncbi:glycine cleavage system protein T [Mycolicibacterium mucogenicum]|uniref:Glycine cleavage system protein T n=1 Tax=Mycolicibacterium mucogenicum TaxID=56689 RepID=A0A1A3GML2_MYCMU|nr:folate-binding protein YgfZ [Mycolicibacterium mucogenicum]OBJ37075.1 glycine cleavage system protein T [Mycolicibacterium mucogenicum]
MSAVPAPESGPDAGAVWHYGDPLGEQRAAATEAIVVDRGHRATIALTGDDRQSWLHTISSQHVSALPEGSVVQNLNLDGQGRVEDHWLQTELGGVTTLDTESWRGQPLADFLRKMVFWSKVEVNPADLAVLSLLGPAVNQLDLPTPDAASTAAPLPQGGFVRRVGPEEIELVVPRADVAAWRQRLLDAGVRPAGLWAYEALRVAALRPRLGVDTDERTIPHEVGWIGGPGVGAVHLDKGCYRGQETVARVHNLGKPPRMLVLLHLDGGDDRPATGDPVLAGGRTIGRVGTVAEHVDLGPVALALLKRGVPADTELTTGGDAQVPAAIDADSLPEADTSAGAGRAAVDRLRGGARN